MMFRRPSVMTQRCRVCNGGGRVMKPRPQVCPQCNGSGYHERAPAPVTSPEASKASTVMACPKCSKTSLVMELTHGLWQCARPTCAEGGASYRFNSSDLVRLKAERDRAFWVLANQGVCPRCRGRNLEHKSWESDQAWGPLDTRIQHSHTTCKSCGLTW
jgi:uncharacterized protein with PIN domain